MIYLNKVKYAKVIRINKLYLHTTLINVLNRILNKITQTQKTTYYYLQHYINYKIGGRKVHLSYQKTEYFMLEGEIIKNIYILIYIIRDGNGTPSPVLLPGKSHGRRSLVGCSPWGCEESDTTERLHFFLFTFMQWRRKWQPTPVFLPGESQGWRSLVGCHLWGHTVLDTTEVTQQQQQQQHIYIIFQKHILHPHSSQFLSST